jgi:hypothetical protein
MILMGQIVVYKLTMESVVTCETVTTDKTVFDAETAVANKTVHAKTLLFPTEVVFNVRLA